MIDTGLKGKIVIVTGANHGIGAATAIAFAREGGKVFITYLGQSPELYGESRANEESASIPGRAYYCREIGQSAEWIVEEIQALGGECMTWEADLSEPETIPKLFDMAEEKSDQADWITGQVLQVGGGNRI
ncbi:MAG: SDR family NAD(P)-dependent oxidoreductase [bacterium]